MKRLLILLILLLPLCLFSQSVLQVYSVSAGPWNPYTREFNLQTHDSGMRILVENSVIRVSDDAHSVYITTNSSVDQDNSQAFIVSWDAVDEKARRCKIYMGMNRVTNVKSMIVMYNDYMFQYFHY